MLGGRFELSSKLALHVGVGLRVQHCAFRQDRLPYYRPDYAVRFTAVNLRMGVEF
jgi:hypothetical protein